MRTYKVVIVGAGQAGAQAAISLRQLGFDGTIAMVGEENDQPYERPPLSKAYLSGDINRDQLALRPPEFWRESQVDVITGERVIELDATARRIRCASGAEFGFDTLVWAAGGHARKLTCDGADFAGVHVVRTRAHVDALGEDVARSSNVVIIGGGYIGLETAAVLAKSGKAITVVEALPRVLARVTSPAVSSFFEKEHAGHGVRVLTSTAVQSLVGAQGRVNGVRLVDGSVLPADLVVVGIGLLPEVAALEAAGAQCANGVEVDSHCRTSLPGIYAIGDCASHVNRYADGARVRLESVQNAVDQAKVAASNISGIPTDYSAVPWFWSNQYDIRLQTVGLCTGYDEHVVRGKPDSRSFSVVYLRRGVVVALDCINAPREFVQGKKLVTDHVKTSVDVLADATRELKLACGVPVP